MRTLILTALTAVLLVACNTDINSIPDVTTTGQLVVVFAPHQWVTLTPGPCDDTAADEPQGGVNTDNPTGRIYYGLQPDEYCLRSGTDFADGILVTGALTLDIVAGAVQYVSVIPVALSPG